MLFNSVAGLPFFMSINTDGSTKEQIIDNLIKENLDSFKYQNQNSSNNAETLNLELNVISNNNNGEVSLKENNKKELGNHEETQVFTRKKRCC